MKKHKYENILNNLDSELIKLEKGDNRTIEYIEALNEMNYDPAMTMAPLEMGMLLVASISLILSTMGQLYVKIENDKIEEEFDMMKVVIVRRNGKNNNNEELDYQNGVC